MHILFWFDYARIFLLRMKALPLWKAKLLWYRFCSKEHFIEIYLCVRRNSIERSIRNHHWIISINHNMRILIVLCQEITVLYNWVAYLMETLTILMILQICILNEWKVDLERTLLCIIGILQNWVNIHETCSSWI